MLLNNSLFYVKNKDTYPPFKNGLYLEEFYLKEYLKYPQIIKKTYIPILWTNFQIEGWFQSKKEEMIKRGSLETDENIGQQRFIIKDPKIKTKNWSLQYLNNFEQFRQ